MRTHYKKPQPIQLFLCHICVQNIELIRNWLYLSLKQKFFWNLLPDVSQMQDQRGNSQVILQICLQMRHILFSFLNHFSLNMRQLTWKVTGSFVHIKYEYFASRRIFLQSYLIFLRALIYLRNKIQQQPWILFWNFSLHSGTYFSVCFFSSIAG